MGRAFKTGLDVVALGGEVSGGEVCVSCGRRDGCETGVRSCSGLLLAMCCAGAVGSSSPNLDLGGRPRFFGFSSVERRPRQLFGRSRRRRGGAATAPGLMWPCHLARSRVCWGLVHTIIGAASSGHLVIIVGRATPLLPSRMLCRKIGRGERGDCGGVHVESASELSFNRGSGDAQRETSTDGSRRCAQGIAASRDVESQPPGLKRRAMNGGLFYRSRSMLLDQWSPSHRW